MKVGIPRGLLYYEFIPLWEAFFKDLDIDYITSPKTDKAIYQAGLNEAIHESCLPLKIFLGHVHQLLGQCDQILIPRIGAFGYHDRVCTRYQSTIDLVANTFRDRDIQVLPFNIDYGQGDNQLKAFIKLGKALGKRKSQSALAYGKALRLYRDQVRKKEALLESQMTSSKTKILLVGHKYNLFDDYTGSLIINYLKKMGVQVLMATDLEGQKAEFYAKDLTQTMPWTFNRELLGSILKYQDQVHGIILLSSFNCGPDSMANDMILRKIKGLPILKLIIDGQEGMAGVETRLESFLDIILFKKAGGFFD
ncbi:MAG: acyl-CoA dehydratase activase-related protein [Tissierellia bacterium]|nr:acyl-CoA dehydratase activase-related protein [Tissierellia bacterium]